MYGTDADDNSRTLKEFLDLKADIAENGLKNPVIDYVEIDGLKYIVTGNDRVRAAEQLGITDQLQFNEVHLPYKGFRTENDVISVRRAPGQAIVRRGRGQAIARVVFPACLFAGRLVLCGDATPVAD